MKPVRILLVDDHSLFRRGLVELLQDYPDIEVAGEAKNGEEALRAANLLAPDLILMDVNMPGTDGVAAVKALRQARFPGRILMLTVSQNEDDLLEALQAGADGYLLKNLEPEDLKKAIQQVRDGMGSLSPEVTPAVLKALRGSPTGAEAAPLSPREIEVLGMIAQGDTTSQVAQRLFITEATVKTHVKNILKKLGAANRAEAIHIANRLGIVS